MRFVGAAARHVATFVWKHQCIPCALLMSAGDLGTQLVMEKRRGTDVDWSRTSRFATIGFVGGPILFKWYEFLDKRFERKAGFKSVAKKVALDQVVFAPVLTALMLTGLQVIEGKGVEGIKATMRKDFVDVLITTYMVYPVLQTFNFWLVPLKGQVLVDQTATVFWDAYISWKTQTVKTMD